MFLYLTFSLFSATLGSGDVDLCLVPEVPIVLDGEKGCLPHLWDRVKQKGYAVVVVAEGAGEELLGESTETDASGNKKLPMIGEFLKSEIGKYFKSRGEEATVKYIDPSYMIRSVPANATDSLYCMQLGQNAVHGKLYISLMGFCDVEGASNLSSPCIRAYLSFNRNNGWIHWFLCWSIER